MHPPCVRSHPWQAHGADGEVAGRPTWRRRAAAALVWRAQLSGACYTARALGGVREWRREWRARVRRYERRPTTSSRARQAGGLCTGRPTAGALLPLACGACGARRVLQGAQVVRRASGAARFYAVIYMMLSGIMISCRTVFSISGGAAARRGPWRRGAPAHRRDHCHERRCARCGERRAVPPVVAVLQRRAPCRSRS